jgi:hypothetical protein
MLQLNNDAFKLLFYTPELICINKMKSTLLRCFSFYLQKFYNNGRNCFW